MILDAIKTKDVQPTDEFSFKNTSLGFSIIEFWKWNQSDLIENRNRGILAEFLVKKGLGIDGIPRLEWDSYDLITDTGVKIEVKSAAYIQAWKQQMLSAIKFDIRPTSEIQSDNNYSIDKLRRADIYVFCVLHHQEQESIDPMKLEQWTFYVVSTKELNEKLPHQKSISLGSLINIQHEKCCYDNLLTAFEKTLEQEGWK